MDTMTVYLHPLQSLFMFLCCFIAQRELYHLSSKSLVCGAGVRFRNDETRNLGPNLT